MLLPYIAPTTSFRKEIEIKKSLFIADIIPIQTIEEAVTTLASKKKEFKDATHHCYAYRIGTTQIIEKSGDDGEPSGTAGHPMLHVLQKNKLTYTLAVVTRYFGGIKLGMGGLTRAYSGCLSECIKFANFSAYTPHIRGSLIIPYTAMGAFEHYILSTDIHIIDRKFTDKVEIIFLSLPNTLEKHLRYITDMTGGQSIYTKIKEEYLPLPTKTKDTD